MASIRRRKRVRGDVWVVDYRDASGVRRLTTCESRSEAKEVKAKLTLEALQATGRPTVDTSITVAAYSERWLAVKEHSVKPRTSLSYRQNVELHIVPAFGKLKLRQLHPASIKVFLVSKLDSGLKRNTVRILHATLRAMLQDAIDDGVLQRNPALGLAKKLRLSGAAESGEEEIKAMDEPQLRSFLATASEIDARHYPLFFLLARTGLRLGEALALHWEDLDSSRRSLAVRKTLHARRKKGGLKVTTGSPKSGKARDVDMSAQLASMLTKLRVRRCEEALSRGDGEPSPWVFATPAGGPLDESAVRKAMRRVLKRAGLPTHFTPHCLRHTFATLMIQRGVPLAYIKEQLGHSSIKVTVDTYGRWLPSGDSSLMDKLDDPGFADGDQMVTESDFDDEQSSQVVGSTWSRREELNLRPADYESAALPLSYTGFGRRASQKGRDDLA